MFTFFFYFDFKHKIDFSGRSSSFPISFWVVYFFDLSRFFFLNERAHENLSIAIGISTKYFLVGPGEFHECRVHSTAVCVGTQCNYRVPTTFGALMAQLEKILC